MPTLAELSAKVDELQTSLDNEQSRIQELLTEKDTTITTLNETITTLQASVQEGGSVEERQAVLDKLTTLKTDLEETVA